MNRKGGPPGLANCFGSGSAPAGRGAGAAAGAGRHVGRRAARRDSRQGGSYAGACKPSGAHPAHADASAVGCGSKQDAAPAVRRCKSATATHPGHRPPAPPAAGTLALWRTVVAPPCCLVAPYGAAGTFRGWREGAAARTLFLPAAGVAPDRGRPPTAAVARWSMAGLGPRCCSEAILGRLGLPRRVEEGWEAAVRPRRAGSAAGQLASLRRVGAVPGI